MILRTERLTLRPIETGDAGAVFRMMSNAEVMAYWDTAEIDDPDIVDRIVAAQVDETLLGRSFYWSIIKAEGTGEAFIGCCDLSEVDRRHHRAEIGFLMTPQAWGDGYAQEAMTAVLEHAASLDLRRLTARTHVGNSRTEALLATLGFADEGVLHGYIDREGERRDCRLWGMLL